MAEIRKLTPVNDSKPLAMKTLAESADDLIVTERVTIETEPGLEINGTFYIPRSPGRKGAVLVVSTGGNTSLAMGFARAGRIVLELKPRGPATNRDSRPLIGEWINNTRAWLIGRNLPAMRAYDISRGVDALAARNDVDPASIAAVAHGVSGIWLLMSAALDTRIDKIWLDRAPYSFGPAFENPIHTNLHDAVIPGFALRWDIQDLAGLMGQRRIFWSDPTDWMGRVVPLGTEVSLPTFRRAGRCIDRRIYSVMMAAGSADLNQRKSSARVAQPAEVAPLRQ